MKTVKELINGDLIYKSDAHFTNVSKAKIIDVQIGNGGSYYVQYEFCNSHQIEWAVGWDGNKTEIKIDEYGCILYFSKEALLSGIDKEFDRLKNYVIEIRELFR